MIVKVRRMIRERALLHPGQRVIVAVSGGMDSMVLLHLLRTLEHTCIVAHVDHGLRGAASDADRDLVMKCAADAGMECRVFRVDPGTVAQERGISLQMAARELRLECLKDLSHELGDIPVAMAHHGDDVLETLLINLIRGAGIHGLVGIPPRSGPFVRPLLAIRKADVAAYAAQHDVEYREDASNSDPAYLRNRVRHELLPVLDDMAPGARQGLMRSLDILKELVPLADDVLDKALPMKKGRIPIGSVLSFSRPYLLLYHRLRPMGFHPDVISDVLDALRKGRVGASFDAGDVRLTVDRDHLLIGAVPMATAPQWYIGEDLVVPKGSPVQMIWCGAGVPEELSGGHEAWLDAEGLRFPLLLRTWRAGDRIRPIGGGSRLVSDLLIDAKVPLPEKAHVLVLCSGNEVIWLAGWRVADAHRATRRSTRVLRAWLP